MLSPVLREAPALNGASYGAPSAGALESDRAHLLAANSRMRTLLLERFEIEPRKGVDCFDLKSALQLWFNNSHLLDDLDAALGRYTIIQEQLRHALKTGGEGLWADELDAKLRETNLVLRARLDKYRECVQCPRAAAVNLPPTPPPVPEKRT